MVAGAAIGAALGGVGGYALGSTVASRKQKYINDEDRLNGEIQVFEKYNTDLEAFNKQTAFKIQTLNQQLADINAQSVSTKDRVISLQNKQTEIKKWISEGNQREGLIIKELAGIEDDQKRLNQLPDQAKVAKLNQEVSTLKQKIAELDSQNTQMAKLSESMVLRK